MRGAARYTQPDNKLRASMVADPAGTRNNTGDNTPAVVHFELVPGDKVDVRIGAKGGGSENKARFAMLNPSDDRGVGGSVCRVWAQAGARRVCWG